MPGTRGPVPVPLRDGARDLTQEILNLLDEKPSFQTSQDFADVPQGEIKAALDRLASRLMVQYDTLDSERPVLTEEGEMICRDGSHEFKVWDAVRRHGKLAIKQLPVR